MGAAAGDLNVASNYCERPLSGTARGHLRIQCELSSKLRDIHISRARYTFRYESITRVYLLALSVPVVLASACARARVSTYTYVAEIKKSVHFRYEFPQISSVIRGSLLALRRAFSPDISRLRGRNLRYPDRRRCRRQRGSFRDFILIRNFSRRFVTPRDYFLKPGAARFRVGSA